MLQYDVCEVYFTVAECAHHIDDPGDRRRQMMSPDDRHIVIDALTIK
jgi:hypothetical protein